MTSLPRMPSLRLDGRRALVAGASSGIGLGCAAGLAEAGAHVVLAARRRDALDQAVAAIRAVGGSADAMVMDVGDVEATAALLAARDPFDILVNSAGITRHSRALETATADFDAVMAVNVRGAYFLAQAVARGLADAGRPGSLITLSSQMGHVGGIERAVYCASKFAVEGFTKSMAMEWGPLGIRVNTICPTFIRTPMTEPTFRDPERMQWVMDKIKLDRPGEVEDIMGAVLYLASDASAMVTGTAMMIDGGWTAD